MSSPPAQTQIPPAELQSPPIGNFLATVLLQHPNRSQQAVSRVRRKISASCEVTQGVGDTWATCPMLPWGIWARGRRAGFHSCSWLL